MEAIKSIAEGSQRQSYLLIIIYGAVALLGLLLPFGYYMTLAWISIHSGPPPEHGMVRVPGFDVIGTASIISVRVEQSWLLIVGLFLLCTGAWYFFKNKQLRWQRLGLGSIALGLAIANAPAYFLNWFLTWFFGGRF